MRRFMETIGIILLAPCWVIDYAVDGDEITWLQVAAMLTAELIWLAGIAWLLFSLWPG